MDGERGPGECFAHSHLTRVRHGLVARLTLITKEVAASSAWVTQNVTRSQGMRTKEENCRQLVMRLSMRR